MNDVQITSFKNCSLTIGSHNSDCGDRDIMINDAKELFGNESVIPVSNFNTLKLKSLVADISKYYEIPLEEVRAVTNGLQEEVMPHAKDENTEKSVFVLTHVDCMKYSERYKNFMEKYPDVCTHIEILFMQQKSLGRHAGGIIIAPADVLERSMPIIGVKGDLQTPWTEGMNFRNLEDNGMIKFDFLGLTLLEDVRNCIRRILIEKGNKNPTFLEIKEFFDKNLNCRFNPPEDRKVFENTYCSGKWAPGIFQFTAAQARKFCEEVQPNCVEDISAITAIYRPGPLKANVHKKYVEARRKDHAGELKYDHPIIKEVLGPTYGFTVYQESFMLLAQKLAGFSQQDSDKLRKTLVKKSLDTIGKKGDERAIAKEKFIKGAKELHGIDEKVTDPLWTTIENMSVYCFNFSHSLGYSIDSYYSAWLYTYYQKHWLGTILQSENGSPDGMTKAIAEIKALGFKFAQPDVNYSGAEWAYSEEIGAFVPPLSSLKRLGETAAEEILESRPFSSLQDLLFDENGEFYHSKMNKSSFEALCKVEAFNSLEDMKSKKISNHKQLHEIIIGHYDELKKGSKGMSAAAIKKKEKKGEVVRDILDVLIEQTSDIDDWDRDEKIAMHDEICNTVDNDLLFPDGLLEKLAKTDVPPVTELKGGQKAIAWFLVRNIEQKKTKTGKTFYSVKAQDQNNKQVNLKIWGEMKFDMPKFSVWLCEATGDEKWGPSTTAWKLKSLEV